MSMCNHSPLQSKKIGLIPSNILRPFTLKTMEKNDFLEKQKMHRKTEIIFNNKTLRAKSTKNIFHLITKNVFIFRRKKRRKN